MIEVEWLIGFRFSCGIPEQKNRRQKIPASAIFPLHRLQYHFARKKANFPPPAERFRDFPLSERQIHDSSIPFPARIPPIRTANSPLTRLPAMASILSGVAGSGATGATAATGATGITALLLR